MLQSTLIKAAQAGGKILQEYFDKDYEVASKDTINNLVTEVDKLSETVIIQTIKEEYPAHQILSEEIGELKQDSVYKWIIDPIDGTVNFAHRIPICCVSIGLEKEGEIILGVVYNPFSNEFFFAEKNGGATMNDKKISVSQNDNFASACLVTGFPYNWVDMPNDPLQTFDRFVRQGLPVRRLGSAALDLCWVACGRFDGFWEHQLNAWDVAAGFLIVKEAGGTVTDFKGNNYSPYQKQLLATNGKIHEAMRKAINGN